MRELTVAYIQWPVRNGWQPGTKWRNSKVEICGVIDTCTQQGLGMNVVDSTTTSLAQRRETWDCDLNIDLIGFAWRSRSS